LSKIAFDTIGAAHKTIFYILEEVLFLFFEGFKGGNMFSPAFLDESLDGGCDFGVFLGRPVVAQVGHLLVDLVVGTRLLESHGRLARAGNGCVALEVSLVQGCRGSKSVPHDDLFGLVPQLDLFLLGRLGCQVFLILHN
jgi:hypothetical protein